ncbi:ABC transporter permease subunit [Zavarzinia compransoris]|uniref:ABC transporter permease n=1 Tax=Zavarzinia compransoris TaxID=1264899 RepID=A0A317E8Y9_9PROT|nr:ABC transporter permease subunit [Zavarzinia compransoris]PWR21773.1 ABC transporter permease [Zavarzinia compransoris]TDP45428.1 ABC-2 type transport system permease protein [Zavarzinia compransoris]
MSATMTIARRELAGYFATPLAYVFIIVFLFLTGIFTFYVGNFFDRGEADLVPFFSFHPWLYLFLIPAIAMRLWAEERKSGTIELLLTLPVPLAAAIIGKFLAAWAFTGIALALTAPMWFTVNYLGRPDNGVILAGYIGSFLMAGAYLAVGSCLSAATRNQVVAFVLTVVVLFLFTASGAPMVLDAFSGWAPQAIIDTIASFSFLTHFNGIVAGVIEAKDIVFFATLIIAALGANAVVIDMKKAS